MKKVLLIAVVFAFAATVATAAELPKPVHKLATGTVDIVKSPIELYDHSKAEMDASTHKPFGLFKGLVEAPFYMIKKAGAGAIAVATFPVE